MLVAYLLMNFVLVEDKIYYILSIILLSYSSIVIVVDLKLLYKELKVTIIVILF